MLRGFGFLPVVVHLFLFVKYTVTYMSGLHSPHYKRSKYLRVVRVDFIVQRSGQERSASPIT